ncbi:MAG: LysR family transcriptional regulator [Enterobacterales bacterium]|nr:LysR family transcriptional regulator [Enterobacterales bacterium]
MARTRLPLQLGDTHIRLLRIFKAVVESGGYASAEVELNISRPAISLAMTELESLLNMRLCHRGRGGFSLTEQGESVYQSSLSLLTSLQNFRSQMNAINTELVGDFNIGITDNMVSNPQMRITRALAALKKQAPEVVINITMSPPNEIEKSLLDGHLHIGVVPELRPITGLSYFALYKEKSRLYCSQQHVLFHCAQQAIPPSAIKQYDAVVPSYPQQAEIKRQQKQLKDSATSTDREGIAFLVLTGHYVGFFTHPFCSKVGGGR